MTSTRDSGSRDSSSRDGQGGVWRESLHIWTLFLIIVVRPLLELLAPNLPFFLHHRADPIDLGLLLLVLAVVLPGLLIAISLVARRLGGSKAGERTHLVILGFLVGLLGIQICHAVKITSVALTLVLASALAAAFIKVYSRRPVHLFLNYLAVGAGLVLVIFLAHRDILGFCIEFVVTAYPEVEATSQTPVVMVVFDEFPLVSLLDEDLNIDADLFPNFANLARASTWYRNATTVFSRTQEAMTSILTGTMPAVDIAPTLSNYPENLFTLLHRSHQLRVYEHHTQFLPSEYRPPSTWRDRRLRLRRMLADLRVVFQHVIWPSAQGLQPLSWRWGFFAPAITDEEKIKDPRRLEADFPTTDPYQRREAFARFLSTLQPSSRPTVDFFHSNLPHIPSCYLPSGKVYGGKPILRTTFNEAWNEDEFFVTQIYQRHLLQVQYVDRLIGQLIDRLKRQGRWDKSLVVITADHGASHWPEVSRRAPGGHDAQVDEILRIPLFIKGPRQATGELSDRNMQSMDILPTMLDLMGIQVDWSFDGLPAAAATQPARKVLINRFGKALALPGSFQPNRRSLARKFDLFGRDAEPYSFYRIGPHGHLLGRLVSEIGIAGQLPFEVIIDQMAFLMDHNPDSGFVPAELTGEIEIDGEAGEEVHLALAFHGRIEAVTRTVLTTGEDEFFSGAGAFSGHGLFSALASDRALRPGENLPEIFVVRGSNLFGRIHL